MSCVDGCCTYVRMDSPACNHRYLSSVAEVKCLCCNEMWGESTPYIPVRVIPNLESQYEALPWLMTKLQLVCFLVHRRLAGVLSLSDHQQSLQEAAQLDYYVAGYWYPSLLELVETPRPHSTTRTIVMGLSTPVFAVGRM